MHCGKIQRHIDSTQSEGISIETQDSKTSCITGVHEGRWWSVACSRLYEGGYSGVTRTSAQSYRLTKSHVIQLRCLRRKTDLDVAQALPVGQLGKCHDAELFGASQGANALVAAVTRNVPDD